jgi:Fe-S cluster assembly protein SufD
MNAVASAGTSGFLNRFEGLKSQLPGDAGVRESAAELFRANGIPGGTSGRRAEAWKYTTLRAVAEASFFEPLTGVDDGATQLARLPLMTGVPLLVFVDGRFRTDLSVMPDAFPVQSFADAPDFGTLSRPDRDNLVALNTMLAEDGVALSVPPGVDGGTLQIVSLATEGHGRTIAFHPRHSIRLGQGASLRVLEISAGAGTYLHNAVSEIHVGEDAHLTHVRLQDEARSAFHVSTSYVEIAARGTYDGFALNLGARLARAEIHARMIGAGAMLHLNGAQLLSGSQHADITTVVSHDAPNCASRQTVKNVLSGRSRGVFQGKIEVARIAQKTDGYQMNQALLLSREAEIDCKPELEIFADDVKCSHGATVGELDRGQIFYLRSRGVPEAEARAILVRAFLTEALDAIGDEGFRAVLETSVAQWWEREAA